MRKQQQHEIFDDNVSIQHRTSTVNFLCQDLLHRHFYLYICSILYAEHDQEGIIAE